MVSANDPHSGRRLSHYLLERRIGAGGMGEVYLAHDLALGRPAAVKLLRPDLAADLPALIRREARTFARLQHPWIATFYEAGEADGLAFIAMEYVDGETLREKLRRGSLPVDDALSLVSCLLEALSHAHAAGVLHRDIKPENVMIVGQSCAKLLDFGIAVRSAEPTKDAPGANTATRWTEGDTAIGTYGYAAPEQLRGEAVDARADLFAVGAVLYEAITGRPAFPGATPTERIARVLEGNPPPLRGPGLPLELSDVARRALAPDPAARYPTSAAFLSAVRRLRSEEDASALPDTIAVLDLANITGDPTDNWMSSGIAESVAADLARLPGLRVVPRERTLRARVAVSAPGRDPDAIDVGHQLGCRWILSGGVQRMGSMLRVTASLTEVPTGRVIGAEKIDGQLESIFAIQDRLAQVVAERLNFAVPSPPGASGAGVSVRAYELYAQGKRLADRLEKGTFDQAAELFEEAIRMDPGHAPALAGLAKVHAMRFPYTTNTEVLEAAAACARRAIEADARYGEPHAWLSYALLRSGDPQAALDSARRAIELDPSLAHGTYFAGCAATAARRIRESIRWFRRTVELEPEHGFAWLGLGWGHLSLDHREEAIWCLERMVALEAGGRVHPTAGAGGFLGECLRRYGLLDAARRSCLQGLAAADASDHMYRDTFRGVCLVALGRTSQDAGDAESARASFTQAALHLRGRPRALGGGHLLVQALAGLSRVDRDPAVLDEAITLATTRQGFDFSWLWCCSDDVTLPEISQACHAVGRVEAASDWEARARQASVAAVEDEDDVRARHTP